MPGARTREVTLDPGASTDTAEVEDVADQGDRVLRREHHPDVPPVVGQQVGAQPARGGTADHDEQRRDQQRARLPGQSPPSGNRGGPGDRRNGPTGLRSGVRLGPLAILAVLAAVWLVYTSRDGFARPARPQRDNDLPRRIAPARCLMPRPAAKTGASASRELRRHRESHQHRAGTPRIVQGGPPA